MRLLFAVALSMAIGCGGSSNESGSNADSGVSRETSADTFDEGTTDTEPEDAAPVDTGAERDDGPKPCTGSMETCVCAGDADCARYEDDDLCNGRVTCVDNRCVIAPTSVVTCDTSKDTVCTRTSCEKSTGMCTAKPINEGYPCEDGLYCTWGDVCRSGVCVGGTAARCPGPCDRCDESTRSCGVKAGYCRIYGSCYEAGKPKEYEQCMGCVPSTSQEAWSPLPTTTTCWTTCAVAPKCDGAGACSGPPPVPSVPVAAFPHAGTLTGSVHAPTTRAVLRPTLRVRDTTSDMCSRPTFDFQIDDSCTPGDYASCTFPSPEASATGVLLDWWKPTADLAVSTTAPMGRRYYWRARACRGTVCSAWSKPSYLDVGRAPRDLDGDGYSDLIVGQPDRGYAPTEGRAHWYRGSADAAVVPPTRTFASAAPADYLLYSQVMAVADFDADGYQDLVIGEPGGLDSKRLEGRLYVYRGGPTGPSTTASVTIVAPFSVSWSYTFGAAIAVGDLDADGYPDLIVNAVQAGVTPPLAWVFDGSSTGLSTTRYYSIPNANGGASTYARTIAASADLDADGVVDVAVAARELPKGVVWWPGSRTRTFATAKAPSSTHNLTYYENWLEHVSMVGDRNGDGVGALFVNGHAYGGSSSKQQLWWYGSYPTGLSLYPNQLGAGSLTGQFGREQTFLDVNGDGYQDVVVAASAYSSTTTIGKAYLFLGPGWPDGASQTLLPPLQPWTYAFGTTTRAIGDFNGDGYDDLAIGDPSAGSDGSGGVHVCLGSSTGLGPTVSRTFRAPTATGTFGVSLAR